MWATVFIERGCSRPRKHPRTTSLPSLHLYSATRSCANIQLWPNARKLRLPALYRFGGNFQTTRIRESSSELFFFLFFFFFVFLLTDVELVAKLFEQSMKYSGTRRVERPGSLHFPLIYLRDNERRIADKKSIDCQFVY